jgi:hypothetical protein
MDGRAFLDSARELLTNPTEPNCRSAAGRAYYALLHEGMTALDRWGFPLPPRENIHSFVRLRCNFASHPDLISIGRTLDVLSQLRNQADYQLLSAGVFGTGRRANQAVAASQDSIDLLDQIEADPARRTAAIAAITAAFP